MPACPHSFCSAKANGMGISVSKWQMKRRQNEESVEHLVHPIWPTHLMIGATSLDLPNLSLQIDSIPPLSPSLIHFPSQAFFLSLSFFFLYLNIIDDLPVTNFSLFLPIILYLSLFSSLSLYFQNNTKSCME